MRLIQFFLLLIASTSALAEPIPPHQGEWALTDSFSYFRSSANYLTSGTSNSSLPFDGTFSTMQDVLTVNYDALTNLRFMADIGYGSTSASNDFSSWNGSGFTEFSAGAQYWWRQRIWALVPQAQFGYPFYRVDVDNPSTTALISNAAAWVEAGSWAIIYLQPVNIYGYIGFRYQDGGQASLLPMDFGVSYRFPQARLRAGVRGETTVINDSDTNNSAVRFLPSEVSDAGSLKFYSLNPSEFDAYGEFDWIFTREWEAGAGIQQTFYGSNAAYGWTANAMVRFRIPSDREIEKTETREMRKQPQFENKSDRYDQQLFDESSPDATVLERQPPPKPVKKKKTLDNMLKDTEKSLSK